MQNVTCRVLTAVFVLVAAVACDQTAPLAPEGATAEETLGRRGANPEVDLEACAIDRRDFTLRSTNDYFPLGAGSSWLLRGEEDGKRVELRVTVLGKTKRIGGVRTRVVEERHFENGELVELSRNYYTATREGTVCYLGEDVDIYEDGVIVSHEGAWRADAPGNFPGIVMPANPRVGMVFQMEGAPDVAEDQGRIVARGVRVRVPAGSFKNTIRIDETALGEAVATTKFFARGVGVVVDGPLSLVRYRVRGGGDDDRNDDDEDDG